MTVNASTTLEYVEGKAIGEPFEWESVVNATADPEDPDAVRLQVELDTLTEEHVPKHMTERELTPTQARALAADLETHADRVEDAGDELRPTGGATSRSIPAAAPRSSGPDGRAALSSRERCRDAYGFYCSARNPRV